MLMEYKLYCIDDDNRITMRHDYSAADDLASLDLAKEFCGHHDVEIWQRARFVARMKGDGTASFAVTTLAPQANERELSALGRFISARHPSTASPSSQPTHSG